MSNSTITIRFLPMDKVVLTSHEDSILQVANKNKMDLNQSCGGNGTCGTCLVRVFDPTSSLQARNEVESEMATDRKLESFERLACQTLVCPGLEVTVPDEQA